MKDRVSRPHWSYSSLSQFLRCPLQYYFERVLGLPRRTASEAQVLGSSVHAALAVYHRKLQAGEPVPSHQIHDAFQGAWDEQADRFDLVAGEKRGHDDSRTLGVSLIDLYLNEVPPGNIVAVEEPFLAPVVNSAGVLRSVHWRTVHSPDWGPRQGCRAVKGCWRLTVEITTGVDTQNWRQCAS